MNNEDALAFYKKFGFEVVELAKNYYKRIEPADAYLVEKPMKGQKITPLSSSSLEGQDGKENQLNGDTKEKSEITN